MAARLECCRPRYAPFPSGWAWIHGRRCRFGANRKATADEVARIAAGVVLEVAPAAALRAWFDHPTGCGCIGCEYVDSHIDEGDDDGRAGLSIAAE